MLHNMMLVFGSLLLCISALVNGDNVTLGIKKDGNVMNTRSCIYKERQALHLFKANLVDSYNSLVDWSSEGEKKDCCKWLGVFCDKLTGRVIEIDLSSFVGLAGKISSSLPLLQQLQHLNMNGIDFQSNPLPKFLGSLSNLRTLDISRANLSGPIPRQLANLSNLLRLDLSHNFLTGSIPFFLGGLTSLTYLDLSGNRLVGVIPPPFNNCSSLVQLNLSENFLSGSVPSLAGCSSLNNLSLGHNFLNGSLPDFSGCLSLLFLDLSSNQLTGNLPNSVGQLFNLEHLDVSSNSLMGVISDVHFLNLTHLTYLDLSFNNFSLELSSFVGVPFQLRTINLQSCKLGPTFPAWLKTQTGFTHIDISSAGISDNIPAWFWDLPFGLKYLNISSNKLQGMLPDVPSDFERYPGMDLSNNHLAGRVPSLPSKLAALNLSGNKFSGTLSFLCEIDAALTFLDLSNNLFTGSLPNCWLKFQNSLVVLNLSNNNISGGIPSSMGFLSRLEALYMRTNALVGELPMSLSNCTSLRFLDVGENKLSGIIPEWLGEELTELYVLVLRSNKFYGSLPSQVCWLYNLQFLDLSKNEISGDIPGCFGNFTAMAKRGFQDNIIHSYSSYVADLLRPNRNQVHIFQLHNFQCSEYIICNHDENSLFVDNALVAWKGVLSKFGRGLQLLNSIDLSGNKLSGKLPYNITSLLELVSLNVSFNKLHGEVPEDMGRLKSLQALDLSRNEFSGNIPSSLSELTFLSYLDLSNNKFSGRIPTGPQLQLFNASVYSGNHQLCGPPLTPRCGLPPAATFDGKEYDVKDGDVFWESYYTGLGSGFSAGFSGFCVALFFNRRCRYLFFVLLSHIKDWIYVTVVVLFRKSQKKFRWLMY